MSDYNKDFTHLHVHTAYSILDGISKRKDLIFKAKEFGMPAMAVTEHGNLFNSISFYKDCADAAIKPIIGLEAYVAPDSMAGRQYSKKGESEEDIKNGDMTYYAYHLTLLAKNREGYDNLKKLSTLSYREGFYKKPRIDDEILAEHNKGLIVLSGCLASKISRLIVSGNKDKAIVEIDKMRNIFGEDFFLETMHHNIDDEATVREALIDIGNKLGIGLVMTGDSHYTERGDSHAHEVALCIATKKDMNSKDRWKFNGDGYWFKSQQEMYESAVDGNIPTSAIDNAAVIARRVEDYGFKLTSKTKKSIIPLYRDNQGTVVTNENCHVMLDFLVHQGLITRGIAELPNYQEYLDRARFELDMIKRKDFSSYFLLIADIIENGLRKNDIISPPGRGSSLGSLVCYSLHITGLDPIVHDIPFARFISEGRKDLPDIDTDISKANRHIVLKYIADKYGHDKVGHIVTFQSMAAKASVDSVGRALGVPSSVRRELGKVIGDLEPTDTLDDVLESNKAAVKVLDSTPKWTETAKILEGNNGHLGEHAAGIVISNEPLADIVPLVRDSSDGLLVTQYDMKDLAELGLLKLDMLGLRTLDLIDESFKLINKRYGTKLEYAKTPLDDAKTYQLIASGKYVSVFQLDSSGIRAVAKSLAPEHFEHVVALTALYRPSPMLPGSGENGRSMMDDYIDCRHGRKVPTPWHPDLAQAFEKTFQICLYQEQLMKLSQILGGFDESEADDFRQAVGKKDLAKFNIAKEKLIERAIPRGYSKEFMEEIGRKIQGAARYSWNRSHSVAYGFLIYVTAWLEANHPLEYYTSLLNVNLDKADKLKILLADIMSKGIQLAPPHINNSNTHFNTDGETIYMGLLSVNQIGDAAILPIIEERKTNGPYKDFMDFTIRTLNISKCTKLTKENLIKAGAFNWDKSFTRNDMIASVMVAKTVYDKFKGKLTNEEILAEIGKKLIRTNVEFTESQLLEMEKAVLNFYISSHPVLQYQPLLGLCGIESILPSQINDQLPGKAALVFGVVESKVMKTTRNGDPYLSLRMADHAGSVQMNIWNPQCTQANNILVENQLAFISGTIKEDKFRVGDMQLNIRHFIPIIQQSGIPISGFVTKDKATANWLLALFGVGGVTDMQVLGSGYVTHLSQNAYIKPEHFNTLKNYGGIHFAVAI